MNRNTIKYLFKIGLTASILSSIFLLLFSAMFEGNSANMGYLVKYILLNDILPCTLLLSLINMIVFSFLFLWIPKQVGNKVSIVFFLSLAAITTTVISVVTAYKFDLLWKQFSGIDYPLIIIYILSIIIALIAYKYDRSDT